MKARLGCPVFKIACYAANDRSLEPTAHLVRKMANDLGGDFGLDRNCGKMRPP